MYNLQRDIKCLMVVKVKCQQQKKICNFEIRKAYKINI